MTLLNTTHMALSAGWLRTLTGRGRAALARIGRQLLLPLTGILLFVGFWQLAAPR